MAWLRSSLLACIAYALIVTAASATPSHDKPKPALPARSADLVVTMTKTLTVATAATTATQTVAGYVKADRQLKRVVRRVALIEEKDRPTSSTAARSSVSASGLTLSQYLQKRLGSRFHKRVEWAGRVGAYRPRLTSWRVWRPLGKVQYITVHNADGVPDEHPARMIRNIYRGHTTTHGRLDAPDVGYHFFVDTDGNIWEGRDASRLGTHVGSTPDGLNNAGNLGVCGLGTYVHETPPRAMTNATVELCDIIAQYYGRPLTVRGHKDWININRFHPYGGEDCPGRLESAVRTASMHMAKNFPGQKPAGGQRPPTRVAKN